VSAKRATRSSMCLVTVFLGDASRSGSGKPVSIKRKMYKRPTLVRQPCPSRVQVIPPGAPGLVGDIARAMRAPPPAAKPKPWIPPMYHEDYFVALRARGTNTEHLEELTKEYYKNYVAKPPLQVRERPVLQQPMIELYQKYQWSQAKAPPLHATVRAMRESGFSEDKVERYIKWYKKMEETYDERTEKVEKIFSKWPSASSKKRKVIKAVKKKLS